MKKLDIFKLLKTVDNKVSKFVASKTFKKIMNGLICVEGALVIWTFKSTIDSQRLLDIYEGMPVEEKNSVAPFLSKYFDEMLGKED